MTQVGFYNRTDLIARQRKHPRMEITIERTSVSDHYYRKKSNLLNMVNYMRFPKCLVKNIVFRCGKYLMLRTWFEKTL